MIDTGPYVGLGYRLGGRDRPELDCWGLVRLVYAEQLGIPLAEHAADPDPARAIVAERRAWLEVPAGQGRAGDVALIRRPGRPFHCGLLATPFLLLHADEGIGTVAGRLDRQLGQVELWRHPLLQDGAALQDGAGEAA